MRLPAFPELLDKRGRPDPVMLAAFDLRTQARDTGHGRGQSGFTGTATLQLGNDSAPAVRQQFGCLPASLSSAGPDHARLRCDRGCRSPRVGVGRALSVRLA